jgi:hypothetical protein
MNEVNGTLIGGILALGLILGGLVACGEAPDRESTGGDASTTEAAATSTEDSAASSEKSAASTEENVEGLWKYTRLETSGGKEMPLSGIFLFKDGIFVQQAIFDGEPFGEQGSMAHAGPYMAASGSVHLVAEQTISTDPGAESPLSSRGKTEHDVSVTRDRDELTLVFGTGTIQEFKKVGPGEGVVHTLEDGALAFVDGYFVLVQGNEQAVASGYGTYEKRGDELELDIIRWAEARPSGANNMRDVTVKATFDGSVLTLANGRSYRVEH